MTYIVIQKLLSTNAHLGRRVAAHHFKVYICGSRNGIAILDSDKTLICLRNACHFRLGRVYCSDSIMKKPNLWCRLLNSIEREYYTDPYPGLRIAGIELRIPLMKLADYDLIVLAYMRLLIKYGHTLKCDYGKLTLGCTMIITGGSVVTFTIGHAISFKVNGENLPVYALISQMVREKAEEYDSFEISRIFIRIYHSGILDNSVMPVISDEDIASQLWDSLYPPLVLEPREVQRIGDRHHRYAKHITALKPKKSSRKSFIVADTETVMIDQVHVPYAVGFLVVMPGDDVGSKADYETETYFSEDYSIIISSFEERSQKMMCDFIERLAFVVRKKKSIRTIYFHNFSRFDGIILLKHLVSYHSQNYTIKPLMRNSRLYEIAVYKDKKLIFSFRDSLTLLPGSLDNLASNLCPQLGSKGSIAYDEVRVSNLQTNRVQLLSYMKQDIRLLGGVMQKAQEIYWSMYNVDIVTKLTLSSLALTIFRTLYYDENHWPIHIPNRNEDTFIRRGYYGGHADVYQPYGENLYYYDVNSLYPYIMKSFKMPGGQPVWHGNLEGQELDNLFGFIEAYVVCPSTITRPFLPYRDEKTKTLLFPTGKFVGVYYSEELKYARDIGYQIIPLSGYLFEKMNSSPFESFVSSLFSSRQEAKRSGNDALSYIYKILMNSLYGRFGINPISTVTEVCNRERYQYLTMKSHLIFGDKLSEHHFIVSYLSNTGQVSDSDWSPPKISAVQLAAAITACSRIYMYPYISREDSYYTDTDSVVLGSPLHEAEISSTVLGQFKLEYLIKKGIFLAPKSYSLWTQDESKIIKHKGLAKAFVNSEWFESQYNDISRTKLTPVESNFQIDWKKLNITKKSLIVNLGIRLGNKRNPIFDENKQWVDTAPLEVTDLAGQENRIYKYEIKQVQKENEMKDREIASLKAEIENMKSLISRELNKTFQEKEKENAKHRKIKDAILYSYWFYLRFVIFLSIFLGFSAWMFTAPEALLNRPSALCSPDLELIVRVLKDTYVNHVCSTHPDVVSPCECGEPLNKTARDLFPEPQKAFDPLNQTARREPQKAFDPLNQTARREPQKAFDPLNQTARREPQKAFDPLNLYKTKMTRSQYTCMNSHLATPEDSNDQEPIYLHGKNDQKTEHSFQGRWKKATHEFRPRVLNDQER